MRMVLVNISLMTVGLFLTSLSFARIDPETVANGHVWLFEKVEGKTVQDSSINKLSGTIVGDPKPAKGINGDALEFNGTSDYITIPDSPNINTGGPHTNRTVKVIFNCADVSIKNKKQTIFEEGGRTRGLVIYVFDGNVYVGAWNRSEYNWNGAWISAPIQSNKWYEVAAILRDTKGAVEPDKFEMWLDGKLINKKPGGQLHAHADDNGIGAVNQNTVFHDEGGSGTNIEHFAGLIDEVWVLNQALIEDDLRPARLSVEPLYKLVEAWGAIKVQR